MAHNNIAEIQHRVDSLTAYLRAEQFTYHETAWLTVLLCLAEATDQLRAVAAAHATPTQIAHTAHLLDHLAQDAELLADARTRNERSE